MKFIINNGVEQTRLKIKKYIFGACAAVILVLGFSAPAFAAGAGNGSQASSSGACHGAFADVNGNFGGLGSNNGSGAQNIGGGVPAGPGAAGYNNSAVSGDCTLPN